MRLFDDASLGRHVSWTMHPLVDASLGRRDPGRCVLGRRDPGRCVPWSTRLLDDASLGRRVPLTMHYCRLIWDLAPPSYSQVGQASSNRGSVTQREERVGEQRLRATLTVIAGRRAGSE
jgi:hypothetical protein